MMDTATRITDLEKPIHPKGAHRVRQGTRASVKGAIPECRAEHRARPPLTAVFGGLGMLKYDLLVTIPRSR